MDNAQYFEQFEENLTTEMVRLCTEGGMLDGMLLATDDIDQKWDDLAPAYSADAIHEIASYPEVSIAWAGYLGMAVAQYWDLDWNGHQGDSYGSFYGPRGFDDMDEHIMQDILGNPLGSPEEQKLTHMLERCTQYCISYIRAEQIEPQTAAAFQAFVRTVRAVFRIGAALQLKMLGYKFEKVNLS